MALSSTYARPFWCSTAVLLVVALAGGVLLAAHATSATPPPIPAGRPRRIAALLVSHGSRSERWRDMLFATEAAVRGRMLADHRITDVRTAFMEYTEPSIATRLQELDAAGFTDIVLVPLLLTVSSHSFDDIPTICGLKEDAASLATLRAEGIRIYKPRAKLHLTPLLDFPAMLEENVLRRAAALSRNSANEGVVLVAYGDTQYNAEWESLMARLKRALETDRGISCCKHSWCGHIVRYSKEPTRQAITDVLAERERALVIPILVAVDENFQHKLIGGAVAESSGADRVAYVSDAILPDAGLENWIVEISTATAAAIEVAP